MSSVAVLQQRRKAGEGFFFDKHMFVEVSLICFDRIKKFQIKICTDELIFCSISQKGPIS